MYNSGFSMENDKMMCYHKGYLSKLGEYIKQNRKGIRSEPECKDNQTTGRRRS